MEVSNSNCTVNIAYNGSIHKSVNKIFKNLKTDLPNGVKLHDDVVVNADDIYNNLFNYVNKTDKDVELYYRSPNIFQDIFSSDPYHGFKFRNKVTKKEIPGGTNPVRYFQGFILNPVKECVSALGRDIISPDINPSARKRLTFCHSNFVNYLFDYNRANQGTWTPYDGWSFEMRSPIKAFFWGLVKHIIALVPKIETNPYSEYNLKSLNKWVNDLTSKSKPEDVNKLLG